jgi:uncharacterized protein (DUF983 family)
LTIVVALVVFSFLQGSIMGAISVIFIVLVIVVTYVILYLMSLKKIKIKLNDGYLLIDNKLVSFGELL